MPAKSKSQQRLFGMALAVRKGELKKSEVNDSVLAIVDSDMTDKQIEDYYENEKDNCNSFSICIFVIPLWLQVGRYK